MKWAWRGTREARSACPPSTHRPLEQLERAGGRIHLRLDPFRNRPLRHLVADHRALPRGHAERLDVVGEDLLERQRGVRSFAGTALRARAEDETSDPAED